MLAAQSVSNEMETTDILGALRRKNKLERLERQEGKEEDEYSVTGG